ncbi:ipa protein [Colletotrichum musicola]|uniref:Ipa protein n=1 Tax=Colletotrichum musicola TaxID=2175873 RepID=A0A8H6KAE7_9PEZI|nr:ipa protein [Colletotrichum musicola]
MIRFRVSTELLEQYRGTDDVPGDCHLIEEMMCKRGLRLPGSYKNCWTFFMSSDDYGAVYKVIESEPWVQQAICLKRIIPRETGELILLRQMYMLLTMNVAIKQILKEGSGYQARQEPPKAPIDAASAAFTKLNIKERPAKLCLPNLIASARDQKASLDGYLDLIVSEPVMLAYDVHLWFCSRPELVPDEKGRSLPQPTDRNINGSLLDAIHNTVESAAIWAYINWLLERLDGHGKDKISNMCHLEYARVQALFKRQVQTGSGVKLFKRMSNAVDAAGNPRVTLKGKPEDFLRTDPHLHHVLRLSHPDTDATKAVDVIKKLSELHQAHPAERERLTVGEAKSLGELAVIVAFIKDLSLAASIPPLSCKKDQLFVTRAQELEAELNQLKKDLDVSDHVVPIDKLLEPDMMGDPPKTFIMILENAGTLGFLQGENAEGRRLGTAPKDARKQWVEAFADLMDAEEVQREAEEALIDKKDLVALQGRAAHLFTKVQWDLRHAMVSCGRFILASGESHVADLVPDDRFQDYMKQLAREEKDMKRILLQDVVRDTVYAEYARVRSVQPDTSTEGEEGEAERQATDGARLKSGNEEQEMSSVGDTEQPDRGTIQTDEASEQYSTEQRNVKSETDKQFEDTAIGLKRKIALLRSLQRTVILLVGAI